MAFTRITEDDLQGKGVIGQPEVPGLSTLEMQQSVEQIVREVAIPGINRLAEELEAATGAAGIGMERPAGMPEEVPAHVQGITAAHIENRENPHGVTAAQVGAYTRQETDAAIDNKVVKFENKHNKEDINKLSNTINRQRLFIIVCIGFVLILTILVSVIVIKSRRLKHAYILVIAKNRELAIANNMSKKLRNKAVTENMPTESNNSTESKERDRETENKQEEEETTETKAPITENEISLTPEQIDKILQGVIMTMENVDIISKPSFTLVELAKMINSNTRYVSWVINNTYNKNFKTLLNEYRIREVCRRMEDNKNFGNLTIQAIYTSLGYSSASNFLRAFKNVNGMTPSTYQKLINENRKAIKHTEENQ